MTTGTIGPINDGYIASASPTTSHGTTAFISVGAVATDKRRTLLGFYFGSIPASAIVSSAVLSLYCITDNSSNARTYRVFRMKKAWDESATWNVAITGDNWTTAGGFDAADCEQTDIGTRAFTATETLNQYKDFTLTAAAIQQMIHGDFANNGLMVKSDTESSDGYNFESTDAGAGHGPLLAITYTLAGRQFQAVMIA